MATLGEGAYDVLRSIYEGEGNAIRPGNAVFGDTFNAWAGNVTEQAGIKSGLWEDLPADFTSKYDASRNPYSSRYNPITSGAGLFGQVGKITSDFFGTSGNSAMPALVTGGDLSLTGTPGSNSFDTVGFFGAPASTQISPLRNVDDISQTPSSAPITSLLGATSVANSGYSGGLIDTISQMLTGDSPPQLTASGAPTVLNVTNAPSTSVFNYSPTTNTNTSITNTTTVNSPDLVTNLLSGLKGFFGTKEAAASSTPFNDATQTRNAIYPGSFYAGDSINLAKSQPGSSISPVAKVDGLNLPKEQTSRMILIVGIIGVIIALITIFRRRG